MFNVKREITYQPATKIMSKISGYVVYQPLNSQVNKVFPRVQKKHSLNRTRKRLDGKELIKKERGQRTLAEINL